MGDSNKSYFRIKLTAAYAAVFLAVFTAARIALYFAAGSFFGKLTASEITYSFLQGMRFDMLVICTFCGLFLFLLNIPLNSKKLIKICCSFLNVFLLLFAFFLAADVVYFKLFEKHLTTELLLISSHFSYFLSLAFQDYILVTLSIIVLTASLFYFSFKLTDKYYTPPNKNISFNIIFLVLLAFVLFFFIRGRLNHKNLSISDAYVKSNRVIGELTLNGVFTSYTSLRKKQAPNKIKMPSEEALALVKENLLDTDEEIIPDEKYPLMRQRVRFNANGKNYNIVFILLESWQKDYIDSIAGTDYGVTPNFDALVKGGIMYDRFYANGQRSIMGLMSVFFSMPYVKGLPYMGYGLENFGQTRLPALLAKNGYDNVFVQGDKRESDKAIFLANYLGFKEAYGKQDIPVKRQYLSISKGYDIEGLEYFFDKVNNLKKPFFGFYFTTTTHIPYAKTVLKELEKYPEDGSEKTGYLNRLYYADYALGEFMNKAAKEEWFENTVFIMCADHQAYAIGGMVGEYEKTRVDKTFKVPMIIYAPSLFKPEVSSELGSQFDIVPTIIDILNIETPYSSLGKSLFSKSENRFAFLSYEGEQVYLVNNKGVASKDWKSGSSGGQDGGDGELMSAVEKTVYNLVTHDKWYDKKILN